MKKILAMMVLAGLFYSCENKSINEISSIDSVNWKSRMIGNSLSDSFTSGTSYLSIYSQIYSISEHKTLDLTVTASIRNTNTNDTIYISKAEYFDTKGKSIRTYFDQPVFVAPMETVEIIIDQNDKQGGTGANFLFHWKIKPSLNEPLFDAVMISTSGQQGISFTTQGKRIK